MEPSEIVLLLNSRSLNSHIYLEPHTASLNLLGTAEMLTRAVPSPRLSLNCKQRGFVPRTSRQPRLLSQPGRAHPPVSTEAATSQQEHEGAQP